MSFVKEWDLLMVDVWALLMVAGFVVVDRFVVVVMVDGTGEWLWIEGREKR